MPWTPTGTWAITDTWDVGYYGQNSTKLEDIFC